MESKRRHLFREADTPVIQPVAAIALVDQSMDIALLICYSCGVSLTKREIGEKLRLLIIHQGLISLEEREDCVVRNHPLSFRILFHIRERHIPRQGLLDHLNFTNKRPRVIEPLTVLVKDGNLIGEGTRSFRPLFLRPNQLEVL